MDTQITNIVPNLTDAIFKFAFYVQENKIGFIPS